MRKISWRFHEAILLLVTFLVSGLGFLSVSVGLQLRQNLELKLDVLNSLYPVVLIVLPFTIFHIILSIKKKIFEQTILPLTSMIFSIGIIMIWRLRGLEGVEQQIYRGLLPGSLIVGLIVLWPSLLEKIRHWSFHIGIAGLLLLFLTGALGVQDETGARLALKLGPLPAIQTSEIIKLSLIIFLAWYIEREGRAAEGRAYSLLWFRLPAFRYLLPTTAFVGAATLALVAMSDYGAVIILGLLFILMLYTGFETRTFLTIAALGLAMVLVVGLILLQSWSLPNSVQNRILAYQNPWSNHVLANGLTVSEGPGYQIQQAIYAVIAGGVAGTGLGLGSPNYIPLSHSDFILAAVIEEMGLAVGIGLLFLYIFLIIRIIRIAVILPKAQIFERLLLIGIGVHFFSQVFVMAGGTFNLIPLTGVTLPFLSQGGVALMVNLIEVGFVLALCQRVEHEKLLGKA